MRGPIGVEVGAIGRGGAGTIDVGNNVGAGLIGDRPESQTLSTMSTTIAETSALIARKIAMRRIDISSLTLAANLSRVSIPDDNSQVQPFGYAAHTQLACELVGRQAQGRLLARF